MIPGSFFLPKIQGIFQFVQKKNIKIYVKLLPKMSSLYIGDECTINIVLIKYTNYFYNSHFSVPIEIVEGDISLAH